jgi:hypothetical protein
MMNVERRFLKSSVIFCAFKRLVLGGLVSSSVCLQNAMANQKSGIPLFEFKAGESGEKLALGFKGSPFREDVKQFRFRFEEKEISTLFSQISKVSRIDKGEYYFELRGVKSAALKIDQAYERGVSIAQFPLSIGETLDELVSLNTRASNVSAYVEYEKERYKCFSADVCAFDGLETLNTFRVRSNVDVILYDTIGTVYGGEATLQRRISDPKQVLVEVHLQSAIDRLGRSKFLGQVNSLGSLKDFQGFSQTLETYGNGRAMKVAHVFPAYGGLKISVETAPFYYCNYTRVVSYPDNFSIPTPLGESCVFPGGYDGGAYVTGSSPGSDFPSVQDWLFQNFAEVKN